MSKDKLKIFIGCFILLVAIILRLVLYNGNSNQNNSEIEIKYFFIDNYVTFSYTNNKINYLNFNDENILKNKFNIYLNGNYFGNYYLRKLPSGLKLLDDNNNFVNYDGYLIGSNFEDAIKVAKLNIENNFMDAQSLANSIFGLENISARYSSETSSFIRYKADFNNDGHDEYLYLLSSNALSSSTDYSILFTYENNEYKMISKEIDNTTDAYKLSIVGILDINNDNQLDIVVAKSKFGHDIECYEIYKSDNMKFKKIKGCK